jgi:hypothetical protein
MSCQTAQPRCAGLPRTSGATFATGGEGGWSRKGSRATAGQASRGSTVGVRLAGCLLATVAMFVLAAGTARRSEVSVSPDGGSLTVTHNTSNNEADFQVENGTGQSLTFMLSCSYSGNVSSCSARPDSLRVGPGDIDAASVLFDVGAVGSGQVTLRAEAPDHSYDTGYYNVTIQ